MNTATDLPDIPLPSTIRSRTVDDINGLRMHVLEAWDNDSLSVVGDWREWTCEEDDYSSNEENALSASTACGAKCQLGQMHAAEEIGIDDFQARRSPDGRYRTTPLRGLFVRAKGGFYHDGRFADYQAVLRHYDATFKLGLSATEMGDLEEFLKSL